MTIILAALLALTQSAFINVQGQQRRYVLHVPPPRGGAASLPLLLVFHGGSDTPENMAKISGFDAVADREGFLVAFPEAVGKHWNDGRETTSGVNDVEFVRRVVSEIRTHYNVDPRRVYATGPSNGGIFSNRLGCEMASTFAAIGPVIGTIATKLVQTCRPSEPISVIGIQGVADPLVPFAGGEEGGTSHLGRGGSVEGSRATQSMWARLDGCSSIPNVTQLPTIVSDGTSVTMRTYNSCRNGVEVVWYEIEGGGHRWPGHELSRPMAESMAQHVFGKPTKNLEATEALWRFFEEHPKLQKP